MEFQFTYCLQFPKLYSVLLWDTPATDLGDFVEIELSRSILASRKYNVILKEPVEILRIEFDNYRFILSDFTRLIAEVNPESTPEFTSLSKLRVNGEPLRFAVIFGKLEEMIYKDNLEGVDLCGTI